MKVELAKTAGFCFGVKRAVDMVYEEASIHKDVYTLGPIIHNDEVVADLEKKGVTTIRAMEELNDITEGTIIIRSHGVTKDVYDTIDKKGFKLLNATCPFVTKIHKVVKEQSDLGRTIIIVGNDKHPEVEGIKGWCGGNAIVIENAEEAHNLCLNLEKKVCIVSQTTFNYKKFEDLVEIISEKGYDILVLNTICNATEVRQNEARELAKRSDAMVVIGGKQSSNTQKLFEICKSECEDTYYIQTLSDLDLNQFKSFRSVGITAGASTPNNIIKEVHTRMSEMSFEQLLEESLVTIHNGEVVEGTVIDVKEDEIILNIGYKADGIITRSEYTNTPNVDLRTVVTSGETMQAKVLKVNDGEGQVLLTYKRLAAEKGNKRIEEAFNNKEVLTAKVAAVLDGGLSVIVDEARVFIPASLVSDSYEKNLQKYAGEEIQFVISEFNPKRRRVIGDRKQLLVAKKAVLQKELFEKIKVGMTVEGTVKNVTDFGAFIDLGGADGLLHISEMSWGRVENPKKVFKVGDVVKVLIKDIQGEKIALSLKFENENPWTKAATNYAVGAVVTGAVARMTDFGAFVELEPGVDALLHVSQISREHVEKPSDVLKIGQEVTAKVVDFNEADKKISLSVKALETPEDAQEEVKTEE
ncbi:4-hydroxy-3-methylbut-2-enyl diphosphate reductase [Anaeromicropila herbilytica]|uniref:4-hydroxy-3-methylbut-2-enyl diphosphate reductase n=2 Tax=Anaeromicropila herbilytica TaxID=2785025 RepID=A0A7R7ELZ3_9FIRM|nr:4-hydroxy-3-methylbut-2-enyl diphosphate reductase [Anaeromicropila herbilytica]